MSAQQLTAFERRAVAALANDAGLAAALLDAWANLPETTSQTVRSLIDFAQLGITEERSAESVLKVATDLGLADVTESGFRPKGGSSERFKRLAFALNAVHYYTTDVHRDATVAQVVLTKPPRPSILEERLSELGWRTADLEPTDHAFYSIVALAYNMPPDKPYSPSDPVTASKCPTAANPGTGHQALSVLTGGLRFPICDTTSYDVVFQAIAQGVISGAKVACDFPVPPPPPGMTIDLKTVEVAYTAGGMGTPSILKQVATSKKDQLLLIDSGGGRFMSFNFKVPPFNDINIRKAVIAGMDRNALRLTRGGAVIGPIMQHQIPPGLPGFDEAGGQNPPPGADWLQHPTGDKTVMAKYFKAAGMSSGKFEGKDKILVVGDDSGVGGRAAEVAASQLQDMGFTVNFRQVPHSTMYTKFCNVPKAAVAFCPNTGWFKDFFDSQTLLDPTFNGANILQENNSNWPQMNDPTVNKLLDQAKVTVGRDARAKLFAQADQKITMLAPNVPWVWDKQPNIASKNVAAVGNSFNATVDLNFTSIK